MKVLIVLLTALILTGSVWAQTKDDEAIKQLLTEQTKAWNNGDIDKFMKTYWNSDSLLFIGKSGAKYGYKTTLENYKKGYPDTTAMGKLHFDILETKRLSVLCYFVVGKWHLTRSIGDLQGHFTLLMRKIKGQWLIVADHSS